MSNYPAGVSSRDFDEPLKYEEDRFGIWDD